VNKNLSGKQLYGLIVIFLTVLLLAIWSWDAVKYQIFPKRFGVVADNLIYRSGQLHPALVRDTLRKYDVQIIIDLTAPNPDNPSQVAELATASELGILHQRFPLRGDGTGNVNNYVAAVIKLHEAKNAAQTLLVHCAAGSQRTGGTVAFYRLLVEKKSPAFVYDELAEYDWHDTADAPLLPYINNNLGYMARQLQSRGVIRKIPDPLPYLESRFTARGPE